MLATDALNFHAATITTQVPTTNAVRWVAAREDVAMACNAEIRDWDENVIRRKDEHYIILLEPKPRKADAETFDPYEELSRGQRARSVLGVDPHRFIRYCCVRREEPRE